MPPQKWAIIVEAPHVCVWPEIADPPCDMRTDDFARRLNAALQRVLERTRKESQRQEKQIDLFMFESDTPRTRCDYNRKACRKTKYRQQLRDVVRKYASNAFVLDVHSFHGSVDWLQSSRTMQRYADEGNLPVQDRPEIVLLDIDAAPNSPERSATNDTRSIARALRTQTKIVRASEREQHRRRLTWLGLAVADEPIASTAAVQTEIRVEPKSPLVYVLSGALDNDIMLEMRREFGARCVLIEFRQDLTGPSLDNIMDSIATAVVKFVDNF